MFKKVLIANRGEIAVRIIRALREMRIASVALYSDVDENSLHRRLADEAYPLGDPKPSESYLNIPKIIAIAKKAGVDAIHPGYGFLSEKSAFAEACHKEGITFIGPSPEAIRVMGDKIGAKLILKNHNVPLIPGVEEAVRDVAEAVKISKTIGYPVLLKAAAGGGGKGMRVVTQEKDLGPALEGAQRESLSAFGDDRVFIEKYIQGPRHIEIQVVADKHGNTIHLFERECSLQRRHQKVIEETPSVALDDELREKMGATAVRIAQAISYDSLGTVEFMLDQNKNFYFLEVNTRLQVEHPITELVTGVDLVKAQVRIAAGEKLESILKTPKRQVGHAIECRICAEDPEKDFLPSIGKIIGLREPVGEDVRLDTGVFEGWTIPMEYDPMLAKLIVYAPTRPQAILKMIQALADFKVSGIKTNIAFLIDLLRHPAFAAGQTETGFIGKHFQDWVPGELQKEDPFSPWNSGVPWRVGEDRVQLNPIEEKRLRELRKKEFQAAHRSAGGHGPAGDPVAPMPGTIRKVLVKEGEKVAAGAVLVVMEAMKMEHSIEASKEGVVKKVLCQAGDKVSMGQKLVEI